MVEQLRIDLVPIDTLKLDSQNARIHKRKSLEALCASLNTFGQRRPIVAKTDGTVIAGNGTLEAAKILEWDTINVVYIPEHWTEQQIRAYALVDNSTAELSSWDADLLAIQADELKEIIDLKTLGLPMKMRDLTNIDEVEQFDKDNIEVKEGQLWQLGNHRLLCKDSSEDGALALLLGDELIDCVWTDPPYGVHYVGKTAESLTIQNDNLSLGQMMDFLREVFANLLDKSKPGAPYYVCAPSGKEGLAFASTLSELDIWKHTLVWVKNTLVMGRTDYHYRHEAIYYGWKPGGAHKWVGDRKQDTVLEFDRPSRSEEHPTMKPIALIAKMLLNSTAENDLICDPFGGSGSTLIAAEQLNRRAYLCDISPRYCGVTISRWQNLTGQKAVLLNG